jgi:hypothetical protein
MERYMVFEHIVQLAKAKAIQKLNIQSKWVLFQRIYAALLLEGQEIVANTVAYWTIW